MGNCPANSSKRPYHLLVSGLLPLARALHYLCAASTNPGPLDMIWYVNSATGNDAHDGRTSGSAFKTLAQAIEAAKAGDTILIAPGAYDQDLPARVSAARSANVSVAVLGAE
jgi:hypothetical protein